LIHSFALAEISHVRLDFNEGGLAPELSQKACAEPVGQARLQAVADSKLSPLL